MYRLSSFVSIVSVSLFPFLVSGCGSAEVSEGGPTSPSSCPEIACAAGQTCVDHVCVDESAPDPECAQDSDCTSPQVCNDGACADPQPQDGACIEDGDCEDGLVCQDNACAEPIPDPECAQDSDCPGSQVCTDGECVDDEPSAECVNYDDCGDGYACWLGECIEVVEGDDDPSTCVSGEVVICHEITDNPPTYETWCVNVKIANYYVTEEGDTVGECAP